jgi:RNA polymerase sigma factor (sigma-70 family)
MCLWVIVEHQPDVDDSRQRLQLFQGQFMSDHRDDPMNTAGIGTMSTIELFEQAVRAHSARLLSIARAIVGNRASPEDVVQQAVMNLFKHRDRYDWREPGGLLKRATVNEALRLLRRPKMGSVTEETDVRSADATPAEAIETNETVLKVRAAIQQLPEHFRAALVLCEYENMSYQQIAETLNCSVPQVKTWIHRGRRKLERILSGYVQGDERDDDADDELPA